MFITSKTRLIHTCLLVACVLQSNSSGVVRAIDWSREILTQLTSENISQASTQSSFSASNVINNDPYSYYKSSGSQLQFIKFDMTVPVYIQGVLIITNPDEMTGGTFNIYVYGDDTDNSSFQDLSSDQQAAAKCDTQHDVGVNAQGGAFNCGGKLGRNLLIYCEPECTPVLSLSTVRAWVSQVVSDDATFYIPNAGSPVLSVAAPHTEADFPTLLGPSSIWGASGQGPGYALTIEDTTDAQTFITVAVELAKPSYIEEVLIVAEAQNDSLWHFSSDFDLAADVDANYETGMDCASDIAKIDGIFNDVCQRQGKYYTLEKDSDSNQLWLEKIVLIGTPCDELPIEVATVPYESECPEVVYPGMAFYVDGPTMVADCAADYMTDFPDYVSGYNVEFEYPVSSNWIEYQSWDNRFKIKPWHEAYEALTEDPTKVYVNVKIVPWWKPESRSTYTSQIPVIFNTQYDRIGSVCGVDLSPEVVPVDLPPSSTTEEICASGSLLEPQPSQIAALETQVGATNPISLVLPDLQDSGSLSNGDSTGLSSCGQRLYQIQSPSNHPYATLQGQELSVQTATSTHAGEHLLKVQVSLADYPDVTPQELLIPIRIAPCQISQLMEPNGVTVSPFNQVFELPASLTLEMPLFEPEPLCGFSNNDVSYQLLTNTDGQVPDWIRIDPSQHTITVEVSEDRTEVQGEKYEFKLKANFFSQFEEVQPFKIIFSEPEPEPVVEEPEVEEEVVDEIEDFRSSQSGLTPSQSRDSAQEAASETQQQAIDPAEIKSWDGWKVLLSELGLNFDLSNSEARDPNYKPSPPTVKIGSISSSGKVKIQFSEPIHVIENPTSFMVPRGRLLQEQKPVLDAYIEAGENSDPAMLQVDTTSVWTDDKTIELSLKFAKPPAVSAQDPEDMLVLGFYGPFFDQQDDLQLEIQEVFYKKAIPPQVKPGALTAIIAAAGETLQATSNGFLAGNAFTNIFLQGSLNQVWGMVNNLQIIIHAPLINISFPGNAFMVYEVMITVATFDILPTDNIYPGFFPGLAEERPFSTKFERLGYETQYMVMNMGTMFIVFTFNALLLLLYLPCKLLRDHSRVAGALTIKIRNVIFFRWLILFVLEAYLDLLLSALITFHSYEGTYWQSWDNVLNNLVALVVIVQLVALPVFIIAYLWPNHTKLREHRFKKRYGPIYEMIDLRHEQATALLWCIFFIFRRVVFALGVIYLIDTPVFQIILFIFPTLAVLVVVGLARPLATPFENRQELYNNFSILLITYCLLCFMEFVPDPETRYTMGYFMVLLTFQNIVVSLVFIAADPVRALRLRLNKWYKVKQFHKKHGIKKTSHEKPIKRQSTKQYFLSKLQTMKEGFFEDLEKENRKLEKVSRSKTQEVYSTTGNKLAIVQEVSEPVDEVEPEVSEAPIESVLEAKPISQLLLPRVVPEVSEAPIESFLEAKPISQLLLPEVEPEVSEAPIESVLEAKPISQLLLPEASEVHLAPADLKNLDLAMSSQPPQDLESKSNEIVHSVIPDHRLLTELEHQSIRPPDRRQSSAQHAVRATARHESPLVLGEGNSISRERNERDIAEIARQIKAERNIPLVRKLDSSEGEEDSDSEGNDASKDSSKDRSKDSSKDSSKEDTQEPLNKAEARPQVPSPAGSSNSDDSSPSEKVSQSTPKTPSIKTNIYEKSIEERFKLQQSQMSQTTKGGELEKKTTPLEVAQVPQDFYKMSIKRHLTRFSLAAQSSNLEDKIPDNDVSLPEQKGSRQQMAPRVLDQYPKAKAKLQMHDYQDMADIADREVQRETKRKQRAQQPANPRPGKSKPSPRLLVGNDERERSTGGGEQRARSRFEVFEGSSGDSDVGLDYVGIRGKKSKRSKHARRAKTEIMEPDQVKSTTDFITAVSQMQRLLRKYN